MIILGLTGSIGMGKTTIAQMFRNQGVTVHDSDAEAHSLMAGGGAAVAPISIEFPGVVEGGEVNRARLGDRAFSDPGLLVRLEEILHPLVRTAQLRFLKAAALAGRPIVVLDIPLLFETRGDLFCDAVVVVTAPACLQRQRVLSRSGMTMARFERILSRQMPNAAKRQRAEFIVPTGLGRAFSFHAVHGIIAVMSKRSPQHWPPPVLPWRRRHDA